MNSKASRASGDYSRWIQGPTDNRSHSCFGGLHAVDAILGFLDGL
jgi:hypothetical protein